MNRLRMLSLCFGLVALWIAAPSAEAQYALGDGRRLDRSLQQGSDGYNSARVHNTAGQYQNALVTGNVGGLGNFRGNVGYRAPGEFTGSVSGDLVYNFQRASAGRGLYRDLRAHEGSGRGLARYRPSWDGGGQYFSRPGSGASAGSITGVSAPYGRAAVVNNSDSTGAAQYQSRLVQNQRVDAYSFSRSEPLATAGAGGRVLQVQAGGLDLRLQRPRINQYTPSYDTRPPAGIQEGVDLTGAGLVPEEDGQRDDPARVSGQLMSQDYRILPLPLTLGERIGGQIQVTEVDGVGSLDAGETARLLRQSLNRMVGDRQVKPGEDVYADMLRRLRGEVTEEKPVQNRLVDPPKEKDTGEDGPKPDAEGGALDRTGLDAQKPGAETLDGLIERLGKNNLPIKSMAGSSENFLNEALAKAERLMSHKRYFDADAAYANTLVHKPGHPLAVAGRVNAQLGAGLYISAATTLRGLLNAHPELIATRYKEPLLPPAARLAKSRQDLERQLTATPRAGEPALMLAYIAYQQGNRDACDRALEELDKRAPKDNLVPLLRRLWVRPMTVIGEPPAADK